MLKTDNIVTNRFVELVEENHQVITEKYMNDLLKNPDTPAYKKLDRHDVYESGNRIYRELSKWIVKDYPRKEIAKYYIKLGKERVQQGVPFTQAYKALVLQRRHLWLFVRENIHGDANLYKDALELTNRVVLYFDRAVLYLLMGYEDLIYKKW
ncbi:MAG TPA: hypothetical protein PK253_04875 [Spirochaetota bacterium]|nr:hypothetical protein [Spirochaetota bacterium]HPQ52560.1 hypothetical protein [Spirochaetota bacterium]